MTMTPQFYAMLDLLRTIMDLEQVKPLGWSNVVLPDVCVDGAVAMGYLELCPSETKGRAWVRLTGKGQRLAVFYDVAMAGANHATV